MTNYNIPFNPVKTEEEIKHIITKREANGWHEKNNQRSQDPEYCKKLSNILSNSDNVKEAAKKRGADPEFRKAVSDGLQIYVNSPDYVNPKGMLGKKATEETKQKQSDALLGGEKPLEGNAKISQARKGKSPKLESIDKMKASLTGKETGRSRKVQTPAGIFDKLYQAAEYYDVAEGSIKNFINGKRVKEWFKPKLEAKGVTFQGLTPLGFKWLGTAEEELGSKSVITPSGIFKTVYDAATFHKVTTNTIRNRINIRKNEYRYISKEEYILLTGKI
jgi:hypothetical protein